MIFLPKIINTIREKKFVRKIRLQRKVFILVFLTLFLIEQMLTPFVLAQQTTPIPETPGKPKEITKHTTLLTESEISTALPYTGEQQGVKSVIPLMVDDSQSIASANVIIPATVHKLEKENYRPNEEIAVVIENGVKTDYKTELVDGLGAKVAVETEETVTGDAKVITVTQPSSFRPGRYTLKITDPYGGVSEQDFRWGVLAVNPDKSVYTPNETANLAIAVLDDAGNMVCNAQVELIIAHDGKEESLSTDNDKIKVNPECESHDFTLNPDYQTSYKVGGVGTYQMTLKAQTPKGSYSITDSFTVKETVPFDVKRISATRIYPPHTYPVTMEITANQDFSGTVTETVPANFAISKPGEAVMTTEQKVEESLQKAEVAGASTTASESAASILSPEKIPTPLPFEQTDVLGYATLNNLVDSASVKAVLGVSIPTLSMPFSGPYPVSQEFGQNLVHIHDEELYSQFGMRGHDGTDFAMPVGTPILSVDDGRVLLAGNGDYGITVVIQHTWGRSYYGHLSSVEVKEGDQISRGTQIARSGNTGITTGPHLHFGIKPNTNDSDNGFYGKVDPAYYLGLKASAGQVLGVTTSVTDDTYPTPLNTDVQILTWKITVKKGDKIKLGYNYLAPRISPQFYTLGPAVFTDSAGKDVFHEERKWQIAADALEYKFKQGSFTKASSTDCAAPCTQRIGGVGFKPKAIIFEWTNDSASNTFSDNAFAGMGFATSSTEERAVSYWAEDAQTTPDTGKLHSATKTIVIQGSNGTVDSQADFVSFDPDGFTLSWTTNSTGAYIIHYTAVGGADVANAKVGSFTLATSGASQSFTDPGFQPDFMMFLANGSGATDTNLPHASMSAGFAAGPTKEAALAIASRDVDPTDSCRKQQDSASIILLAVTANCTSQDALADLASFDTTGFTLNVPDLPSHNTPIYYLAMKGGKYDVGTFLQPTTPGQQTVYTGFRPSGIMTMSASSSATTSIQAGAGLTVGGGSPGTLEDWCNDTTGTECYAPGAKTTTTTNTDWCNDTTGVTCTSSWTTRKKITINNASSSANLSDFPLLVKLNSSRIDYSKTQNSGQDIRFVDPSDPTVALNHEIESWNESGDSYVWVKVPQLDAGSNADYIWMYYNNASASDGQNATGVWDSNYAAVYHMKEDPSVTNCATNKEVCDSTSNANNADNTALVTGSQVSGKVNGSIDFNGSTQHLLAPDSNSLDIAPNISISAWIKADDVSTWHEIVAKHVTMGNDANFGYQIEDTSKQEFYFKIGATYYTHMSNTALSTGTWYHVSVSYDQSNVRFYLNGVADGTTARAIALPTNTEALYIGNNAATERFDGTLDEIRISNSARSEDWVEAEYRTMTDNMNSFGTEVSYGQGTGESRGWTERRKITIDNDASNEDLIDFPLLVKLDATRINYDKTQNSGQDIRFVDPNDPSTVLPHEIESWDENGSSYVWVKVPQLDAYSNTDYIWMYYGNPTASDGQDASKVWDTNYLGVWHLKEDPTGSAPQMQDSTYNSYDATSRGTMENSDSVTAKVGKGLEFDGTAEYIDVPHNSVLNLADSFTISFWMKFTGAETTAFPSMIRKGTISGSNGWLIYENATSNQLAFKRDAMDQAFTSNNTVDSSTLRHYTVVYNKSNGTVTGFVNGVQDLQSTSISFGTNSDTSVMTMAWGDNYANIQFDEPRISNISRSANWVEAEYLTSNDSMNSFGAAEVYGVTGSQAISQGAIWFDEIDNNGTSNNATSSRNDSLIHFGTSPTSGTARTVAKARLTAIEATGFTLNWPEADATARQVLYWTAGSVTASQDDFRWYKNVDSATVSTALEDESQATIIAKNKPYVRLRTNISVGGNGLNASTQGYKLQYYAQQTESGIGGTTDWCNDTTGITCTAPLQPGDEVPASTPTDWCNDTTGVTCTSDWSARRKITFNNASSSASLTDFPVLVKLDSSRIDYSKTQNSGQDIRFVDPADPNTVLSHEIETWNESGDSIVWVKVPTINGRSNTDYIWMYYGNSSVSDGQAASSVWDSSFELVYHLEETGSCTVANSITDSTSNANHGVCVNTPAATTGKFNGARDFLKADVDYIQAYSVANDIQSTSLTYSAWVKLNSVFDISDTQDLELFALMNESDSQCNGSDMWFDATDGAIYYDVENGSCNEISTLTSKRSWDANTWYYIVGSIDVGGTGMKIYANGELLGTNTTSTRGGSAATEFRIAAYTAATPDNFDGIMDEARISSTARSADWIRAEYLSGLDQFNTYGTEFSYAENKQSNTGWSYRKKITFDNSTSNENLMDFPVLVKLDANTIDYTKTQDDGGDIRFVDPADPTTVLNHEIETWNENGTSTIWVKVPQIDSASSTDSIWMYYGNSTASDGQNGTGVWESSYNAVYHLKEDPSGGAPQMQDSTTNNLDATSGGSMTSSQQVTGKSDGSLAFDGSNDSITASDNDLFTPTGDMTISFWTNLDRTASQKGSDNMFIYKNHPSSPWYSYQIYQASDNRLGVNWVNSVSSDIFVQGSNAIGANAWYYVTFVRSGTSGYIYVNGNNDTSTSGTMSGTILNTTGVFEVGGISTKYTDGIMDEVRLSSTARSADWIEAEYKSMNDQFTSISDEYSYSSGGTAVAGWKDVADPWCNDASGITCNTSWTYRKRITIDNSSSTTNLTSFPVLVKLDSSRIDYSKTQNSGQDIRFVDPNDPNTVLDHEIETWNENGASYVWVEVPQLDAKSASDAIWIYYGNGSASDGQATASVWDSNFVSVHHLNETVTDEGTSATHTDSTSPTENGTQNGNDDINGKVGKGQDLDGNDQISAGDDSDFDFGASQDFTISVWVNTSMGQTAGVWPAIVSKETGTTGYAIIVQDENVGANWYGEILVSSVYYQVNGGADITDGTWHKLTMQRSGSSIIVYQDGVLKGSATTSTGSLSTAVPLMIGSYDGSDYLDGIVDELKISNTARSADWITAEYLTESDQMNTFGAEETQSSSVWKFKNNTSVSNGATISTAVLGSSTTGSQLSYQEANPTTLNPTALAAGERREFDFSLDSTLASPRRTYYFRLITAEGEPLTNYTRYPSITVGVPHKKEMRHGKWTNYKQRQPFSF